MKLCKRCDKEVEAKRSDAKFCSSVCRSSHRQEQKKDEVKLYKSKYYEQNKVEINASNMSNYFANKVKLEDRDCKYCSAVFSTTRIDKKFCNKTCGAAYWRNNNKEYIKQDQQSRYENDINRKISTCLRSRLNKALKGNIKSESTMRLIGCTIDELKIHIESQFESWMNWENHGVYSLCKKTWQFDHIKPFSLFYLSDREQQKEACNYKNLQPMLAKNNLIKGKKYE